MIILPRYLINSRDKIFIYNFNIQFEYSQNNGLFHLYDFSKENKTNNILITNINRSEFSLLNENLRPNKIRVFGNTKKIIESITYMINSD